jgi:hypothetical protein
METRTNLPDSVTHIMLPQLYGHAIFSEAIAFHPHSNSLFSDMRAWAMLSFVSVMQQCK